MSMDDAKAAAMKLCTLTTQKESGQLNVVPLETYEVSTF